MIQLMLVGAYCWEEMKQHWLVLIPQWHTDTQTTDWSNTNYNTKLYNTRTENISDKLWLLTELLFCFAWYEHKFSLGLILGAQGNYKWLMVTQKH